MTQINMMNADIIMQKFLIKIIFDHNDPRYLRSIKKDDYR